MSRQRYYVPFGEGVWYFNEATNRVVWKEVLGSFGTVGVIAVRVHERGIVIVTNDNPEPTRYCHSTDRDRWNDSIGDYVRTVRLRRKKK